MLLKRNTAIPILLAGLLLLASCRDDHFSGEPSGVAPSLQISNSGHIPQARSIPNPGEEYLYEIERQVPGFGGIYYDDAGDLVIYLKDLKLANAARAAVKPYKSDRKYGQMDPSTPAGEVRFRQGRYSFSELDRYFSLVTQVVFEVPGVLATDADEYLNRVRVDVRNEAAASGVYAKLKMIPVPREAVVVSVESVEDDGSCTPEMIICPDGSENYPVESEPAPDDPSIPTDYEVAPDQEPIFPDGSPSYSYGYQPPEENHLRGYRNNLEGGLLVTWRAVYSLATGGCTLGFNVGNWGTWGAPNAFVTNSHCTEWMGQNNGTAFYQATYSATNNGSYIGNEIYDPPFRDQNYWVSRNVFNCPTKFICRWSDAAIVSLKSKRTVLLGSIARTHSGNVFIDPSNPRFSIRDKSTVRLSRGQLLEMVGARSGWIRGRVTASCQDGPRFKRNEFTMCQEYADYPSGSGDSGAPVFINHGNGTVTLYGINSGGTSTTGKALSHMINLERDLGQLQVR
jgi:hypothetical protein